MDKAQVVAIIWNTIAAFFTISVFSFMYKDNFMYKIAESIVVGISAGYFTVLLVWTSLRPKFWEPIVNDHNYWYLIPGLLGLLMYFRFSPTLGWLARYPLALYIGIGSGIAIPLQLQTFVLTQVKATILPVHFIVDNRINPEGINNFLIVVFVITALIYFFFSLDHKGIVGRSATFGIWIIMIGFGASFGYTVMARVSLLIGRIQFLMSDWLPIVK